MDRSQKIPAGDLPDETTVVDDEEPAVDVLREEVRHGEEVRVGRDRPDFTRHEILDFPRREALVSAQKEELEAVSLGEDSDELVVGVDDRGSGDSSVEQDLDRLVDVH